MSPTDGLQHAKPRANVAEHTVIHAEAIDGNIAATTAGDAELVPADGAAKVRAWGIHHVFFRRYQSWRYSVACARVPEWPILVRNCVRQRVL